MNVAQKRRLARIKRKTRVRKKISGTIARPRLCVFRSSRHIYAQIIEDENGRTLAAASTLEADAAELKTRGNIDAAKVVGALIAKKALAKDIKQVVFDRSGFLYRGRVQALAEAAREAGLQL